LTAFHRKHVGLHSPEALTVLAAAPTPAAAAKLIRAGRRRNLGPWVERLHECFAATQACGQLLEACEQAFLTHPDVEIITSFPGLGNITGARILTEIGDDRSRFADPASLKAARVDAPPVGQRPAERSIADVVSRSRR